MNPKTIGLAVFGSMAFLTIAASEPLTIYTSRSAPLIEPLLAEFTAETGIETQYINDKAPKLIARLTAEGEATPADLFMPADISNLDGAAQKGLLKSIQSDVLAQNIPEKYRDTEGRWFGLGKRLRVIVYNNETVDPTTELSTYEDLADPKWQGEVLVRTSSHPYNLSLIAAMIDHDGEATSEAWVEGIVNNLARPPQGGDRDQIKAVAAGEGKVAIVNSYYYARMLNSDVPDEKSAAQATGIYFPNQNADGGLNGVNVNLSGAGVLTHSNQAEQAQELLEWLSSPKAQRIYADSNQEYPVNPVVKPSETLQSFGEFKEDDTPFSAYSSSAIQALQITDRSGWK